LKRIFVFFLLTSVCYSQHHTFSFGPVQQQQNYQNQGYPYYPRQPQSIPYGGGVPAGGGGNGGGIPIGAIIGLVGALANSAFASKKQQNIQPVNRYYNNQNLDVGTAAGSENLSELNIPTFKESKIKDFPSGVLLSTGDIKSPFSSYVINMSKYDLQPGHIVTDPVTRKNFKIPFFVRD